MIEPDLQHYLEYDSDTPTHPEEDGDHEPWPPCLPRLTEPAILSAASVFPLERPDYDGRRASEVAVVWSVARYLAAIGFKVTRIARNAILARHWDSDRKIRFTYAETGYHAYTELVSAGPHNSPALDFVREMALRHENEQFTKLSADPFAE